LLQYRIWVCDLAILPCFISLAQIFRDAGQSEWRKQRRGLFLTDFRRPLSTKSDTTKFAVKPRFKPVAWAVFLEALSRIVGQTRAGFAKIFITA